MKTGKPVIVIIGLIIILLTCQLLPAASNAPVYFDSHGNASGLQFVSNPLHNPVPVIDNSSVRQPLQKIPVRRFDGGIFRREEVRVFRTEAAIPAQPADIRSLLRETISPYFNGSKYKSGHLKI